ncbi:hypothetical protein E2C01_007628 [Portunus trituberculatus]|uniref:Uncharacterized protein n=1 Tax=Portunus trituberculatus TaxID=210409 RepID=A0A5B7CYN6_PORTR|nr:hypothetical protein [Portunus trituberculatus]
MVIALGILTACRGVNSGDPCEEINKLNEYKKNSKIADTTTTTTTTTTNNNNNNNNMSIIVGLMDASKRLDNNGSASQVTWLQGSMFPRTSLS